MELLSCTNLRFGYAGQPPFACPDFTVGAGDLLHIAGENGTGKTTLLRVLAGLLPVFSGRIRRAGALRPGSVGYLPQRTPFQDDFPATAREIALSGCQAARGWRPFYTRREKEAAQDALRAFEADDLAGVSYRALSGGQRQRVLLARALALPRRLLLLDEPSTGLDAPSTAHMRQVLEACSARGTAIVLVTHASGLLAGVEHKTVTVHREAPRHD